MDEPDIPMLDVGDFEVLDECVGEDDNEDYRNKSSEEDEEEDDDHNENPKRKRESQRLREQEECNDDENSGDNADNILDVSIDVAENEFLENVAKDFSENIEDDIEDRPLTRSRAKGRGEPTVQIKRLATNSKKVEEPEVVELPRKKPGPRSKTMNIQTPTPKKIIKKINYSDKPEKKENATPNQKNSNSVSPKSTKASPQKNTNTVSKKNTSTPVQQNTETKNEQSVQKKTPAFLKKDLTDEEIMIHFDEIENTVLTSESFVIQNDVEQAEKEKEVANASSEKNQDDKEAVKNEGSRIEIEEEENWDDDESKDKIISPQIKIEEEEFKESEMWYKEKIKAKENIVEEKFTKLSKLIQYSYPMYKKWLDKNEASFGTAICRVEPSKHSPLDQLHPNRWKFICNKKHNQDTSKEEDKEAENTSDTKKTQTNWQVIPGVPDAKVENEEDYPPFVMRVVKVYHLTIDPGSLKECAKCIKKVFEEFLRTLEEESSTNEKEEVKESESENAAQNTKNASEDNQESSTTTKPETDAEKTDENNKPFIKNLEGLTLLLRCNRKQDLMMHITGKNISSEFMDKIKDLFENGPGKDCNVKSLYLKTIIKENNVIKTNNTFLLGSETLDDNVGPVKIQLAPKANVWANLAGVEVLSNVITEYLVPTKKTTIIEIGCGTGLISLLLASKCQKVIGVDIQKEIVEAEILCELNEIKNATFVTGKPKIVMSQIDKVITNTKAVAIVNTNNVFGRSIEVISALRKMTTLGRIVVITNLTKQATRSILELCQPADSVYGNPFIPIKACIVDTTPKNFGFDIVMSMERRNMKNLLKSSGIEGSNTAPVGLISKSKQIAALKYNAGIVTNQPPFKKGPIKFVKGFKAKPGFITGKKFFPNPNFNPAIKFQGKRPYPGSDTGTFYPGAKKFKQFDKPWLGPNIRPNPMHDKKLRDVDNCDLREKLSSNRVEPTAIAQEVQEQKKILDAAKEKLTGVGGSVDNDTVKKLAEMLNLAIEKTNKLQSQLPPRSVWDRIAPPDPGLDDEFKGNPMKGRLVKEAGPKDIIITTSNSRDMPGSLPGPGKSKKYDNIPPLEPNLIAPIGKSSRMKMTQSVQQKQSTAPYQKPGPNRFQGGNYRKQETQDSWGRSHEPQERWSRPSPPRRMSPPRQMMRSPPRQQSPPRRPISPARRPVSPPRRPISPPRRPASPNFRQHSSSRNIPSGRQNSPPRRHNSPPRRPSPPHYRGSPPRQSMSNRQKSPPPRRYADEWDIPTRGNVNEGSGWSRQEKEKSSWSSGPPNSSSNWNQGGNNTNRYRPNDTWDNPAPTSSWNNKNQVQPPQNNPNNRWKGPSSSNSGSTNWDVVGQRKEPPMRELPMREPPMREPQMREPPRHESRHDSRHEPRHEPRHEQRHEPRHESRHEPRWEPPEKPFRNDKEDWNDLPEDARDPWDDHPPSSTKNPEPRWNNQSNQQNQSSMWGRDKPNDNWVNKSNFPMNNMGGNSGSSGGGGGGMNANMPNPNMNMNMGMGMGMNNPNKSMWQQAPQQQPNRNQNWMSGGNWQGGGAGSGGGNTGGPGNAGGALGNLLMGNTLSNWQPPQQNFSNFQGRPFNNNPAFMNNRR